MDEGGGGSLSSSLVERVGAVHLHSTYSDGSDPVRQVIDAATAVGLDYVVLTDHDTRAAASAGYGGYHGDMLLVIGAEVTCTGGGRR